MIPRQLDLVPEIKAPAYALAVEAEHANALAKRREAPVTISRYPLLTADDLNMSAPATSPTSGRRDPASGGSSTAHPSAVSPDLRLYSYVPDLASASAPGEVTVFFPGYDAIGGGGGGGGDGASDAEDSSSSSFGGSSDDDGEDDENSLRRTGTSRKGGAKVRIGAAAAAAAAAQTTGGKKRARRYRRTGEPRRLHYTAVSEEDKQLRLTSVPLPEYEHFTCVLVRPSSPTAPSSSAEDHTPPARPLEGTKEGKGNGMAVPPAANGTPFITTVLARPLLELRCDRAESTTRAANGEVTPPSWLSARALRVSRRDWKSMDEVEKDEVNAGTRWDDADRDEPSDGDDGAVELGGVETGGRGRPRKKRSKGDMTPAQALAAARAATRVAADFFGRSGAPPPPPPPARRVSPAATGAGGSGGAARERAKATGPATATHAVKGTPPVTLSSQSVPSPSSTRPSDGHGTQSVTTTRSPQSSSMVSSSPSMAAGSSSSSAGPQHPPSSSSPSTTDTTDEAALPVVAVTVLQELRTQRRPTVPMKELEKLVLKRLPSYAVMAERARIPDTKAEAAQWFRVWQASLKRWLLEQGCAFDSSGSNLLI